MNNKLIYKGDWTFTVRKDFALNPTLSIGAKMLYIALRSYCSQDCDTAFPSSKTLAAALKVGRDTVFRYAEELEGAGFLKREQGHSRGGKFAHTIYTISDTPWTEKPWTENTVTVKHDTNTMVPLVIECTTISQCAGDPMRIPADCPAPVSKPEWADEFGNEIPENLRTQEFVSELKLWHAYRREIRKPYKSIGAAGCLKQLSGYGPICAVKAIRRSISSGWQGLFDPEEKTSPGQSSLQRTLSEERMNAHEVMEAEKGRTFLKAGQ